jgi:hypothetical protein
MLCAVSSQAHRVFSLHPPFNTATQNLTFSLGLTGKSETKQRKTVSLTSQAPLILDFNFLL